jgi:hypothetical protein
MEQSVLLIDQPCNTDTLACLALLVSVSIATMVSTYLIKRIVDNNNIQGQEFESLVTEFTLTEDNIVLRNVSVTDNLFEQ